MAAMTMVKKIRSGKVLGILIVSPFLLCVNFCRKKAASRNFHLAGRRRLPFIGAILAQIDLTHNTLWTLSPVLRKILHKRPGTSGQLCCDFPGSPPCWEQSPAPKGSIIRAGRAENVILHVLSAIFTVIFKFCTILYLYHCTLCE